jgi:hypothetical protein
MFPSGAFTVEAHMTAKITAIQYPALKCQVRLAMSSIRGYDWRTIATETRPVPWLAWMHAWLHHHMTLIALHAASSTGIFLAGSFARFGDFEVITLATEKKFRPFFRQIMQPDGIQGYLSFRQICSHKNNFRYCVSPNCHCKKHSAAQTTLARGLLSSLGPAMAPGARVKSC